MISDTITLRELRILVAAHGNFRQTAAVLGLFNCDRVTKLSDGQRLAVSAVLRQLIVDAGPLPDAVVRDAVNTVNRFEEQLKAQIS